MGKNKILMMGAFVALLSGCDASNNNSQGVSDAIPAIPSVENAEQPNVAIPQEKENVPAMTASQQTGAKNVAPSPISSEIKGGIDPSKYVAGQTASVTFSGFPQTLEAFKAVQEKLGTTPEGAVVLELMAFEIFCHDQNVGKQCLELCNVELNIDRVYRILKDRYDPKYGSYYNPFLVATFLEGATPMNGYKANKPFKVNVRTHTAQPYEDAESYRGTIISLQVQSKGYDTEWRGVSVVKSKGCPYYKVVNNPSMYTQCKPVSFKSDDEYVDICQQ